MSDEKELNDVEKLLAGILLILFTCTAIYLIVGYWPNQVPPANSKGLYSNILFHIDLNDSCVNKASTKKDFPEKKKPATSDEIKAKQKKLDSTKLDSAKTGNAKRNTTNNKKSTADTLKQDSINKKDSVKKEITKEGQLKNNCDCDNTIQFNTLLLILVSLAGFLGNMIHIGTSFTTFVGAGTFKRSWLLWYFVRPFTASALALVLYFVLRAGFLNFSNDVSNINIYGIMTMSMLAGLFTDIATQKLKEIFEAAFRPKETRPDTLEGDVTEVTELTPDKIDKTKENEITIKGKNLNKIVSIKINSELISNAIVKSDLVTIKYTVPATQSAATEFKIVLLDKQEKEIYTKILKI